MEWNPGRWVGSRQRRCWQVQPGNDWFAVGLGQENISVVRTELESLKKLDRKPVSTKSEGKRGSGNSEILNDVSTGRQTPQRSCALD